MNREESDKLLQDLYDLLDVVCQGLECPEGCTKCCGPVIMSETEASRLGEKGLKVTPWDKSFKCTFCGSEGCSRYSERPLTCRLFGLQQEKDGPFGCKYRMEIEKGLPFEDMVYIMNIYFKILVADGFSPADIEEGMAACMMHDHANGMRKRSDADAEFLKRTHTAKCAGLNAPGTPEGD